MVGSPALQPTPPSPLPSLLTLTVSVCSGRQSPFLLPTPSPVITKFVAVFSEDFLNKLPLMRDIQYAIELVSGASLPACHTIRLTMSSKTLKAS